MDWKKKSCEVLLEADLWLQRSYSILKNALNIIHNGFPGWFAFLFLCSSLFRRGFCFFNSVAITAKYLRNQLNISKILIVDMVCIAGQSCISVTRDKREWISMCYVVLTFSTRKQQKGCISFECGNSLNSGLQFWSHKSSRFTFMVLTAI